MKTQKSWYDDDGAPIYAVWLPTGSLAVGAFLSGVYPYDLGVPHYGGDTARQLAAMYLAAGRLLDTDTIF